MRLFIYSYLYVPRLTPVKGWALVCHTISGHTFNIVLVISVSTVTLVRSHWLLSHINTTRTIIINETGMNPVASTILDHRKELTELEFEPVTTSSEPVGYGLRFQCYGRPLLQAWLLPDLAKIPDNFVGENSLQLSGYGIGFSSRRSWFKSCLHLIFLPCIHSFVSLLRTLFIRPDLTSYCTRSKDGVEHSSDCMLSVVGFWFFLLVIPEKEKRKLKKKSISSFYNKFLRYSAQYNGRSFRPGGKWTLWRRSGSRH